MALLRALAWLFILIATVLLASDLTRSATSGGMPLTSALSYWKSMAPQSLTATMQAIQQKAHPLLWDPVMVRVLLLPAWGLVGTLGIIFGMLGRRKRRINIYHN